MGAPWFQIARLVESDGLIGLSANFPLYGDMSNRMMSLAAGLGPTQEIYSIDESFIGLDGVRGDLVERAHKIRARILQWVGIPCGIGIGGTKTLAKLANHVAKSAERKPGSYPANLARVCSFAALSADEQQAVLQATAVGDVWGVGRRIGAQLKEGARSRRHIERYYGTDETGKFPGRLPPINIKADVDLAGQFRAIKDINLEIRRLNLASYAPLRYVLPHKQAAYDAKYSTEIRGGESFFRQADREESLIHLLRVNVRAGHPQGHGRPPISQAAGRTRCHPEGPQDSEPAASHATR